jgi:DnaJ-class molecular chaperone
MTLTEPGAIVSFVARQRADIPPGAHRCKTCHGLGQIAFGHTAGRDPGGEPTDCPDCGGTGWVKRHEGSTSQLGK